MWTHEHRLHHRDLVSRRGRVETRKTTVRHAKRWKVQRGRACSPTCEGERRRHAEPLVRVVRAM